MAVWWGPNFVVLSTGPDVNWERCRLYSRCHSRPLRLVWKPDDAVRRLRRIRADLETKKILADFDEAMKLFLRHHANASTSWKEFAKMIGDLHEKVKAQPEFGGHDEEPHANPEWTKAFETKWKSLDDWAAKHVKIKPACSDDKHCACERCTARRRNVEEEFGVSGEDATWIIFGDPDGPAHPQGGHGPQCACRACWTFRAAYLRDRRRLKAAQEKFSFFWKPRISAYDG